MESSSGTGGRWAAYRPSKTLYGWSIVGAVVATIIVGFTWGGWVTEGGAKEMAASAATEAHDQLASAVCVGKVMASPDAHAVIVSLKAQDSYDRGSVVQKGGWATMPGQEDADSDIADSCAQTLASMTPPAAPAVSTADGSAEPASTPASPEPATAIE
jgi:hypothetical protein